MLVRERDFDGALAAADRAVALAPYDTFMLSSLMMVLVQAGRADEALKWADQVAARDAALGWFYNHRRGWAYLVLGRFGEAVDSLSQTEFNDSHLLLAIAYVRLGHSARLTPRGGENDEDQSNDHVEILAFRILLPRSCNPQALLPRSLASGRAADL